MHNKLKILIEIIAIVGSVLLSFYIENLRKNNNDLILKNILIDDLIVTIDDDLIQINNILNVLLESEKSIIDLQNDIDKNHFLISDLDAIQKLTGIEFAVSFFHKDGIYNELISTGSFQLIENKDLKKNLLEIYNHLKDRNNVISRAVDDFYTDFFVRVNSEFRIRFSYNSFDGDYYGSKILMNFDFNKEYYLSNSFYGLLSQALQYVKMYSRLLKDIEKSYKTVYSLSKREKSLSPE